MLKYLDLARLVGAGIRCPTCGSMSCRQARWRSKHEKLSAGGFRPYRCDDCASRFLAANGASTERYLINGTAAGILVFAVLTAIELWPSSHAGPATKYVVPNAIADSEKSQAEIQDHLVAVTRTAEAPPVDKVDLLKKAAEDGDAEAMVQLGRLLAPKDVEKAAHWMQLAAAMGNTQGMFELGRLYRDGTGLMPNSVRAYFWFSRAASANHADAMQERDELVRTMSNESLREARKLLLPEDWPENSRKIVKK